VFEAGNIALFVATLAVWHPSSYLSADSKQYLDPADGNTERVEPGYASADQRSWFATVLDPFGWMDSWKGVKTLDRFWERDHPIAVTSFAAPAKPQISDRSREIINGRPNPYRGGAVAEKSATRVGAALD
jgi:hypothetical protein